MNFYIERLSDYPSEFDKNINNCYADWYNQMDAQRRQRVDRIKDNEKQRTLILSDHLARSSIAKHTDLDIEDVTFFHGTKGKPYLSNSSLQFSLSHSGDYVAFVCSDKPCGIDIEVKRQINLQAAKRFCTENELSYILNSENKNTAFLFIWTRKEAYFKSIGCGISTILSAVDVLKTEGFETIEENDYVVSLYIKGD